MRGWLRVIVAMALLIGACEEKFESPEGATLKGKVVENLHNSPLPDVKVATLPSYKFTNTDSTGMFVLENLCPRSYRLYFTLTGWADTLKNTISPIYVIDTIYSGTDTLYVDSINLQLSIFTHTFQPETTEVIELHSGEVRDIGEITMPHMIDTTFDTTFVIDTVIGG
jgi:hypothetical protein